MAVTRPRWNTDRVFRVLGPLEVEGDDGPIAISGQRPRALLTALLVQPNAVVSTDRLVDALWGEEPPEGPANALQQVVARLRSRLGPVSDHLRTAPGGYTLVVPEGSLDADVFESLVRRARAGSDTDPRQAAVLFDRALALWRGTAYAELADGPARPASVRLAELRIAALEDRAALLLTSGQPAEAVGAARSLVAADPLRERPVGLLMRALHASGRKPEALDAFREHRERLADELGLDPSADLRMLETSIIQDELAPPPTALPAGSASPPLPWRVGDVLGRESELELLRGCLASKRLVTLVGPGGVGKTRLALEAAHQLAAGRPVWWAEVATVPTHRLVDTIAEACGSEQPRGADPVGALASSLRTRPGMLVIDNAESQLEDLAPVVERLAASVPDLVILATSRERLAVATEHVHLIAPLPLPSGSDKDNPAVRLFLERAHGLESGALSADALAAVSELCRRLDGLPLAIELGAARAPSFGLREFAALVAEEIDLLAGGRRTAAARHRTLRAVVDASYALLTSDEAALLARLSVFPGPFDLEQARVVCHDETIAEATVATALARLVEQSMVQAGDARFWLLETLRTYAAEHLDDAQERRLRAAHAHHVAARLRSMSWQQAPSSEPEVVAAIARMSADLHLAWDHAVAGDRELAVELAADIYDFAYPRQRRDLLEWGLVVAGWQIEHPRLPRALATAATAAWADGDLQEALMLAQRGLAAGEPDDPATARSMVQSANIAMFAGRQDDAMERFEQAQALYAAAGERIQSLMSRVSVYQAMTYAGRADEAVGRLHDLLQEAQATGNPTAISWVHYVTGEALADTDVGAAMAAYRAAVDEGRRTENRLFVMLARSALVALAAHRDEPANALEEFESVVEQWSDLRNEAAQWGVLTALVSLLVRVGDVRDAAILTGAVRANHDRQPLFERHEQDLLAAVESAATRLDSAEVDRLLATGAAMTIEAAVAQARQAIRLAREDVSPDRPG